MIIVMIIIIMTTMTVTIAICMYIIIYNTCFMDSMRMLVDFHGRLKVDEFMDSLETGETGDFLWDRCST